MFNWLKEKISKFWKWLVIGGATVAIAATILPPEPIPEDLLLKVDKVKILESKEVDWMEIQKDGSLINKGRIIKYDYISDVEVGQAVGEDLSKRTGNAQFFKKRDILKDGKKVKEEWVGRFYNGTPFWKAADKWYQTETATTTIDAFNKQTISFFEKTFGIYAITSTTYAGGGDGYVRNVVEFNTWAQTHDAATGDPGDFSYTATTLLIHLAKSGNDFYIARVFLPFDTSAFPDDAIISAADLIIDIDVTNSGPMDIGVVQTTQPSTDTLATADYDLAGATHGAAEGAARTTIASGFTGSKTIALYSTSTDGVGWISKTGWTKLGIRHQKDLDDVAPTIDQNVQPRSSEYAGTASDPYLSTTYTVPAAVAPAVQIIIFE